MDFSHTIMPTLVRYAAQLPLFIVWLVGIAIAVFRWKRHPVLSLMTVIAVGLSFSTSLVATYLNLWLPLLLQQRGLTIPQIGIASAAAGLFQSLTNAASWGLVFAAIFGSRAGQLRAERPTE